MKRLSTEEIHIELLHMLMDIKKVCDNNKITYYLSGGTLLGAVRHNGFIPWDDDVDIMIHRSEYSKFEQVYREQGKYDFWSQIDKDKWNAPYNRVVNQFTKIEAEHVEITHGLFVDVFPIDKAPKSKIGRMSTVYCIKFLDSLRNGSRRNGYKNTEGFVMLKKMIINPLGRVLGSYRCSLLIDKLAQQVGFLTSSKSEYCGVTVVSSHYRLREFVPASIYEKNLSLTFESIKVNAPSGYDIYLSSLYGDYMELPPKENRIASHYPVFWNEKKKEVKKW